MSPLHWLVVINSMASERQFKRANSVPIMADPADIFLNSIRLQTTLPAQPTMEGTLFTACPITNLVAISTTASSNTQSTHHILPISSIHNFTLVSTPPASNGFASPPSTTPALSSVSTAALQARADAAVARLKEAASRKNKNVGKEAQDLFDGISRTLPTRWDGNNIIVMDSVVISAPYRGEDCKAGNGVPATTLSRVRKVVSSSSRSIASFNETEADFHVLTRSKTNAKGSQIGSGEQWYLLYLQSQLCTLAHGKEVKRMEYSHKK